MKVGTIKETKIEEYRVGLTPSGAHAVSEAGHSVLVEHEAGAGSGFSDGQYEAAGARICSSAAEVAATVDLLVKVKEPQEPEFTLLRPGLILFTYLHLAPLPELTRALLDSRTDSIAYETVRRGDGSLPLLIPMSQVAGRMAAEIAAQFLKKPGPGRGKLLGGIAGVSPARALVIGSGNVGTAATRVLAALGAQVTVSSTDLQRLSGLEAQFRDRITTRVSSPSVLAEEIAGADIMIGAVLVPGGIAPKLVSREMVRSMGAGAVIVDVCIDQGGIAVTSRPTTHSDPIYVEEGVIHYCVPNMPGAVPRTSTEALTSATLPYVLRLAQRGIAVLREDEALAAGASTIDGNLVSEAVARAQELPYTPLTEALAARLGARSL
ncbi:MAG: alanine dehydrogenase [Chloroflexi bacterium]|nr:MAG: alanine dehydrogenase [Chloroflexota bacterium]